MKLFFSLVFIFFSTFLFQIQAQVLIEYPGGMSQFKWSAFSDSTNIQEYIKFRNEVFATLGAGFFTISGINIDKSQLIEIEKELALYKQEIKTDLRIDIEEAEEAIQFHWENIISIEKQIQAYAGLGVSVEDLEGITVAPMIGEAKAYRNAVWDLYQGDHEIIFNMVEKKDEDLYKALGGDDEAYAQFILPYVKKYTEKIEGTAKGYSASLQSAYAGKAELTELNKNDVAKLIKMYSGSLEIYNCFNENFKNPKGEGQQALMGAIETWHRDQGLLGADSLIETYEHYGMEANPHAIVSSLHEFREAPGEVKVKVGSFFRDIWNDDTFKMGTDNIQKWAHINSLIGLKYLDTLNEGEEKVFNEFLEKEIIRAHPNGVTYTFRLP